MVVRFHADEIIFRVVIIITILATLGILKKVSKSREQDYHKFFIIALFLLLIQHSFMMIIRVGEVYFSVTPPEPYFPLLDHGIETLFFIFFLVGSLKLSIPSIKSKTINIILSIFLTGFVLSSTVIFFSYITSYSLGVEFGNHWGDLVFEAWHLIMIEVLVLLFSFYYLAKREKKSLLFLFAMIPWLIGHVGHVLNLAISDNTFIPLRWIEWPFLAIGMLALFFAVRAQLTVEKKEE